MSKSPYYRWFPSDWFGGKTRLKLTGSETATYLDFIFRSCAGQGATGYIDEPLDDVALLLATLSRPHEQELNNLQRLLNIGCILHDEDLGYYNERALQEIEYRAEKSAKASKAGKASGKARKRSSTDAERTFNGRSTDVNQAIVYSPESESIDQKPKTETEEETGGSGGTPSPSISTKKKAKPKKPHDDPRELAALFGWWQEVWDKPRARLTKARKAALVERMKEDGYSLAEVYAGIAGHLFDDYDGRRRKQLGACEPHVLLRVNRQTKHDALEAGLEQFRSKDCHVKALSLMPPEYAVQMAESWGDLYRSEAIHKLLGLTPQQAERVREALNGGGEMTGTDWKCHAYRALVLHHNGEDLTEAAKELAEIAEPPDPRSVDVPPAMLDRMMDLGPVVDFGGAE